MNVRVRATFSVLGRVSVLISALGCLAPAAHAEEASRAARAEELFRQGKALLGQREYARACPLLAASFDLDPGTGTLLALAICHEGEGKLASASAEYKDAAARAKTEGRADRERVARDRALALESRLSTLAITPPPEAWNSGDFSIRRSGIAVERDAWDVPVALDGGEYVIEASASGKKPWRAHVTLAPSTDRKAVTIPPLENVAPTGALVAGDPPPLQASTQAAPPATAKAGPPVAPHADSSSKERGFSSLQLVGIGGMVAGAVGIGIGTFYAVRAMHKYDDSNENGCNGDTCVGQGKEDRLAARSAGDTATVFYAVGATLGVAGAVTFVLGAPSGNAAALSVVPRVSSDSRELSFSMSGSF